MLRLSAIANFLPAVRRALNVGVAESRACLRVDPAQLAFVDRFMYGRWGAALRIAVIVLPWWLLLLFVYNVHPLLRAAIPYSSSELRSTIRGTIWMLATAPISLYFMGGALVVAGARRTLRSREWENEACTIPNATDSLFRVGIRSAIWIAFAGTIAQHLGWLAWRTVRVRQMGWQTGSFAPFLTRAGQLWHKEGSGSFFLAILSDGIVLFRDSANAVLLMAMLVAVLLFFRRASAGMAAWFFGLILIEIRGSLSPNRTRPIFVFRHWFAAIAGDGPLAAGDFVYHLMQSLPMAFLKLALAATIVGHLRIVYDREGPGIGRRWR